MAAKSSSLSRGVSAGLWNLNFTKKREMLWRFGVYFSNRVLCRESISQPLERIAKLFSMLSAQSEYKFYATIKNFKCKLDDSEP